MHTVLVHKPSQHIQRWPTRVESRYHIRSGSASAAQMNPWLQRSEVDSHLFSREDPPSPPPQPPPSPVSMSVNNTIVGDDSIEGAHGNTSIYSELIILQEQSITAEFFDFGEHFEVSFRNHPQVPPTYAHKGLLVDSS